LLTQATIFPEQVSTSSLAQNLVYASGTVGAIFLVAGLLLIEIGGVRRVNIFNSAIQSLIGFFIGFATYFLIGYAIWNWQYYVAFGVENPYGQAIQDWWLGGTFTNAVAQDTDPAVAAGLNNQQIFLFFLACFAGIINMLIHLAVTERIKPAAFYVVSFVAAIVSSVLSWLTYGSTGPLTNLGFHDFFGVAFVYIFAGIVGVYLAHRLGPRPGFYTPHPRVPAYRSYNLGLAVAGLAVIFAGLPMVILSCGFFFEPEALFISVNMSDTSVGIAFNNLAIAWAGGAVTGTVIAYRTRKYIYTLLGPLAGYVSGAAAFDIYKPWQMALVALVAPIVAYLTYEWSQRRQLDEHKLLPLFVATGAYGLLMTGLISWGTPQGGYFGLDSGTYAYQNAEVNILWQVIGLVVTAAIALATAAGLAFVLERTIGLRVDDEVLVGGYDLHYWDIVHDEPIPPFESAVAADPPARTVGNGGDRPGDRTPSQTT
jgi:ammonia channel protein AmtB